MSGFTMLHLFGFRVGKYLVLVVPQDDLALCLGKEVCGSHGYLAAPAGRVHDECRDSVTGRVSTELFYYVHAYGHGRAEVARSHRHVALIEVIRAHPYFQELMHELFHGGRPVVHALQKHRLAAERYPRVGQARACFRDFNMETSSSVTLMGSVTGTLVPILMMSRCGMARSLEM